MTRQNQVKGQFLQIFGLNYAEMKMVYALRICFSEKLRYLQDA